MPQGGIPDQVDVGESTWNTRNILITLAVLSAVAVIGTVTVTLGGGTLLFFSPILLLFSPILVPAVIIFVVLAGGALGTVVASTLGIGIIAWIYNYVTGNQPPGSDQVDAGYAKVKDAAEYARQRTENATEFAKEKLEGAVTYASGKGSDAYGAVQRKGQETYDTVQQKTK